MDQSTKALLGTKYLKTEGDAQKLGRSDAEVAFVGRSNAGKSTLINAICQKKKMAHVSQVPGKTRTINVYEVSFGRWIVDLPGYGYAVGSKSVATAALAPMIEGYLNTQKNIGMVFVVVDAVVGPTVLDRSMIEWLMHDGFPFSVIVNKIDKVKSSVLEARKKEIASGLARYTGDLFWVSSKENIGIKALQQRIAQLLNI
ncbi:MAG: YihA family ribosome biogenesis GTP-binding protein [Candidatus Omnitrophica bacterium]|nr:YihA family ribosome biogenesis GTP-binding protein [Candidatus Omnitrophota bacterium]